MLAAQSMQCLAEGLFTATYKFALLAALADLCVQLGEDADVALQIPTEAIAEKFVEYLLIAN